MRKSLLLVLLVTLILSLGAGEAFGVKPACHDGSDNDGDGTIDFPSDIGCTSKQDRSEIDPVDPPPPPPPPPPPSGDKPNCTTSLQSLVDSASSGGTVSPRTDCIYRETVRVTKPLTIDGGGQAEIRGSDVWTDFAQSGSTYVSTKTVPGFWTHGECNTGTQQCLWAEQVFFDGKPLTQVASAPVSGQFAVDASRRVVLGDNPAGHKVEVTTRREWIDTASSDVTIQGFTMKHASNDSQSGAVNSGGFSRVTIQDNVLSDAHGANASLSTGTDLKLLRNDISRGGQLGVHGDRADALVEDNKIYGNNTEEFGWGWEAGGLKMAVMRSLTLDGNEVYDNKGPGLWCDIDCTNVVYSNNRVHHNTAPGIFFEISSGAKIFGNTVWENGYDDPTWGWGAGILSSSSSNVEIYDNVVAWNADGISVVSQGRGTWSAVQNVNVHDNDILMKNWTSVPSDHISLSWLQDHAGVMYNSTSNNRGSLNRYYYTPAEPTWCRFSWNGCISTIASFNSTPGEEGGRYLTESEKDQVLSSQGVPTTSEHS